jgi:pyruvate kinase
MRLTKIICTLGPATGDATAIRLLARAGMNIARLNLSHATLEVHHEKVKMIKQLNEKEGLAIGIMLDTKGAEIRTGEVVAPIEVKAGQEVVFSYADVKDAKRPVIRVNYEGFGKDVRKAECIFVDNGELIFDIVKINRDGSVIARCQDEGKIGSRRHINLPGADVSLPSLFESDWKAVEMGCKEGADMVALSFIRNAKEVEEVRAFIKRKRGTMAIMTKIETRQAVDDIDAIIAASDSIMVARGDLGSEMPFQRIPAVQDDIVLRCRRAKKPVLVATHMLESMIKNPLPTRAEVTDVAHAAVTRADATMLSGETANGKFPFRALQVMAEVLVETEKGLGYAPYLVGAEPPSDDVYRARAAAAVTMAESLGASAIVVLTRGGSTAQAISTYRPSIPIIACTPDPAVQRRLQLSFGVYPLLIPFSSDPEATVKAAFDQAKASRLLRKKDRVVLVSDIKVHKDVIGTVQARSLS